MRRARKASARPRLLAVDLDGTLLDHQGKPHERDVRALRALSEAGIPVSIVTGRLYSGTRHVADALGLRGPVACVDGSHVVDCTDHGTLLHHGIAGADALTLRDCLVACGPATFLLAKDCIAHDARGAEFVPYVKTWSTAVSVTPSIGDHPFWYDEEGITAAVAVGTPEEIQAATDAIRTQMPESAQVAAFPIRKLTDHWGLVARAAGGTKGSALRWLAAHYGCALEETVCVGDWMNDLPMFSVAGRSFAMGQAPDEVKAAATDVLEETSEQGGGVARAIELAFRVSVG